jgi:predicted nucleotidyltransferase
MRDIDLEATLAKLRECEPELKQRGVASVAVFGSVARGDATAESDIDLLVEFSVVPDLIEFSALQRWLSQRLGRKVDLVTKPALHPLLRNRILAEAVYA